jgi:peptide/nickel transport system permease protein
MSQINLPNDPANSSSSKAQMRMRTLVRLGKYSFSKLVMLFITTVIGVYLTILIANMGGYVDDIMRGNIREQVGMQMTRDPNFKLLQPDQKKELLQEKILLEEKRLGLNKPFVVRSVSFLFNALKLNLGRALNMSSDEGSRQVRLIILERLPATLLLMGSSNFILFFGAILVALGLSRQYGSLWDKFIIAFSPTSAAPPWFYGLFLILIFAASLRILPFGGIIDSPPPDTRFTYILSVLKHTILPVASMIMSSIFVSIYSWRTFFLIYSSEDYVEMAKAKGLSSREIENRYILRPTLPNIITDFSLMIIALWTGAIVTETVFQWPGLGRTFFTAIGLYDTAVIVGLTIIYAYLLALTVFLLDFIYALVDPRVQIGNHNRRQ